ncbi:unnamed protein product [Parascedosporium putredinis]|uniref:AAA+ ATPase domain-containing protein n=1 Tax=Parascedosporium putredinis TaxID=1442378 RepID=A0A9P1H356_9PEZI|nr:unnamed protein product [Parascedosporium putredinis]CAI7994233.1 unnamed protein product [Parascedosporium putredinis]
MSNNWKKLIRREGLTVLHEPSEAAYKLDIVITHGLNGHPFRTFNNEETNFFWPGDLPRFIPNARITVFGYLADTTDGSVNRLGVQQHAESLLTNLKNNRLGALSRRPIIFLGHSLGGVVIKQTLVLSSMAQHPEVFESTKAIFFLGTPHRGSHVFEKVIPQLGLKLARLANRSIPQSVNGVVDKDSAVLDSDLAENIPVARDHRTLETLIRKISEAQDSKEAILKKNASRLNRMAAECLKSLSDPSLPTCLDIYDDPHERTLNWVWERDSEYFKWLAEGGNMFAISGKPGSGKTVLMNALTSRARKRNTDHIVMHHFFNNRRSTVEYSLDGFLRSVLSQALRQEPTLFATTVVEEWRCVSRAGLGNDDDDGVARGGENPARWTTRSLKRAVRNLLREGSLRFKFLIYIDAIDELQDDAGVWGLIGLLVDAAHPEFPTNLKICFSTRDIPATQLRTKMAGFRLDSRNESDITNFINARWESEASLRPLTTEMVNLKRGIIHKADGIFLWARLALDRVLLAARDGATVKELQDTIKDIPSELEGMFDVLLSHISDRYLEESNTMFGIVLTAVRPLTLNEFRLAMALAGAEESVSSHRDFQTSNTVVRDDEAMVRRLRARCGGLLEVSARYDSLGDPVLRNTGNHVNSGIVQFIHQSVKDFLAKHREVGGSGRLAAKELQVRGHTTLARTCLQYLSLTDVRETVRRREMGTKGPLLLEEFPFLRYAAENWVKHCSEAEKLGTSQAELIEMHMGQEQTLDYWCEIYSYINPWHGTYRGCGLAWPWPAWEDAEMTTILLKRGANLHHPYFNNLITSKGLQINFNAVIAGANGNTDAAHALLKFVSDTAPGKLIEESVFVGLVVGWSMNRERAHKKKYSSIWGTNSLEFLEKLASEPDLITSTTAIDTGSYGPALSCLIWILTGCKEDQLRRIIDMDDIGAFSSNPFFVCIFFEHAVTLSSLQSIQYLAKKFKTFPTPRATHPGGNLLHLAIYNTRGTSVLSYLLDQGLDIDAQDDFGYTPLHLAASGLTSDVVQLLLNRGANITTRNVLGMTPFHAALTNPRLCHCLDILDRLLGGPEGMRTKGQDGTSVLHVAAGSGHVSTVEWLLHKGCDLHQRDDFGRTPLHMAALSNAADGEMLELLLDQGLSIDDSDDVNMTALHHVLSPHDEDHWRWNDGDLSLAKARVLIRRGAKVNAADEKGNTALHLAAWGEKLAIVRLLLRGQTRR